MDIENITFPPDELVTLIGKLHIELAGREIQIRRLTAFIASQDAEIQKLKNPEAPGEA